MKKFTKSAQLVMHVRVADEVFSEQMSLREILKDREGHPALLTFLECAWIAMPDTVKFVHTK